MSALPSIPRITQRVIQRPMYRNRNIDRFDLWYRDNEPMLVQRWNRHDESGDADPDDQQDYFASPYELERLHHELQQHEAREESARLRELGWSPFHRDTGIPKHGEI